MDNFDMDDQENENNMEQAESSFAEDIKEGETTDKGVGGVVSYVTDLRLRY